MTEESFTKDIYDIAPKVKFSPGDFTYGGYPGNMATWENFGKWNWSLIKDRNKLSEETVLKIKELVRPASTDLEKAKILYAYLQNKTRYVSIQVGIGGFQPFDADWVDQKSYGDCKALVNYMKSMLEVAGIKSYYTLVCAGADEKSSFREFPANYFNHIILCLPIQKDTLWLECTSQKIPFGFLGDFTDDRDALLITENGGKLVHTKVYDENENVSGRTFDLFLDNELNLKATVTSTYKGLFYDYKSPLLSLSQDLLRKNIVESISEPNLSVASFRVEESKSGAPVVRQYIELSASGFGSKLSDRIIVPTNFFRKLLPALSSKELRTNSIYIDRSYTYVDTIRVGLAASLKFDSSEVSSSKETPFGTLRYSVLAKGTHAKIIRKCTILQGEFKKEDWVNFVAFINEASKSESMKLVVRKN